MATVDGVKARGGLSVKEAPTPTPAGADNLQQLLRNTNVSVANTHSNVYPPTKTSGIQVRGGKAQTKGKMARGPMG